MTILAIAGGTGGVGKTVVEQLRLHGSHHKVFILSRKVPNETAPGSAQFLEVDYENVDYLTKTFEDYNIETVISTLSIETESASQAQLNLIAAADKSQVTRRFIPSEFVSVIDEEDPNAGIGFGGWIPNAQALKKTNLEYIRISIGFFMDYWGMPHIKTNLHPFNWILDMQKGIAVIPGDGDAKFTVTYSENLGRVIVSLLDMKDKWPEHGFLSGTDISTNELIAIAEKVKGSKIHVIHDTMEKLKKGDVTLVWTPESSSEEEFKPMMAAFYQLVASGSCVLPQDERRLDRLFPEIQLATVEEILTKAWKGN